MSYELKEALKELGRVVVLAIIPVLISSLESGVVDWKLLVVIGAVAGLRFIDKLLHNYGILQESGNSVESVWTKGLTRF